MSWKICRKRTAVLLLLPPYYGYKLRYILEEIALCSGIGVPLRDKNLG
jgi:hypothetical protein